ncbi:MAG: phosphoribosylglycinamide formyltransferase [Geminicoccaceae bacterium]|nr:MAG: phosphoribosylglycinamide formyltransferase [Geminicoccaceae bacterium]
MRPARVAVLASGSGSNLQALLDAAVGEAPFRITQVVVNRADAFARVRAERAGVAATLVDHTRFAGREPFEAAIDEVLRAAGIEWVCLAGFMRVLTPGFVERWRDRMLNVHPSLLPAFTGLHTHRRVLAAGLKITGCTVHVVRPALDDGPVVVQAAVPVVDGDDEASLAARVLTMEHRAYPLALRLLTSGAAVVDGERVRLTRPVASAPSGLLWPDGAGR